MASRRESRMCAAQNDALMEFENFKKKYLLVNKHVTKLNSTLSVRIEELNAQISKLQVENLRLRSANLNLAAQLKREREGMGRDPRTAALVGAATAEALRQLNIIRDAILTAAPPPTSPHSIPTPPSSSPVTLTARISGPVHPTQSTRLPVARAPDFPSLIETSETPYRRRSSGTGTAEGSDADVEPLVRVATLRATLGAHRVAAPVNMNLEPELEPDPKARRPARRQSGLITRGAAVSAPEMEDEDAGFETNPEENEAFESLPTKSKSKPSSVSSASSSDSKRGKRKLVESDLDDGIKSVGVIVDIRDENNQDLRGENVAHKPIQPAQARAIAITTKLQDVTNSPRRPTHQSLSEKEKITDDLAVASIVYPGTPAIAKVKPRNRTLIPTPTSGSGRLTPIPGAEDEEVAPGGRERRARKSVNYAEPKLNTKMRKPTPDATSYGPRISLPAKPRSSSTRDPSPPPDSPMPALIDPPAKTESIGTASSKSDAGTVDAAVTIRTARRRRAVPSSWGLDEEEAADEDADDEYAPHNGGVRRKSSTKAGERRHSSAV